MGKMATAGNEEPNSLRHCLTMVFTTCHLAYISSDIMYVTDALFAECIAMAH